MFGVSGKFLIVVFVMLTSIRLWSFHLIPNVVFVGCEYISIVILVINHLIHNKVFDYSKLNFKTQVGGLIVIPFVSGIGAWAFHNQSFIDSLIITRYSLFWLLYFVLHYFDINPKSIIKLMLFTGCVWAALTVVQQFTYPIYYFFTRSDSYQDNISIYRAGVYRYMLYRHHYGIFLGLFFFHRFLLTKVLKNLIPVLVSIVGFYYFGTRQFAFGFLFCLVALSLMQKGGARALAVTFIVVFCFILYEYQDVLFGDYIEMTSSQISDDDDIRVVAMTYYLLDYWPSALAYLIGNGVPHYKSMYGKEIQSIEQGLGLFRSDIGIFGSFNIYGIFYVINVFWLNLKGLKSQFYNKGTVYLKLVFINSLLLIFITDYYSHISAIPFFCFVLYLVDKSYESKKNNL